MSALQLSRAKPFPSLDKKAWENYTDLIHSKKPSSPIIKPASMQKKNVPASVYDLPLIISLHSLGKLHINPVETKSFSTTSTLDVEIAGEAKSFSNVLLSTVKLYPSNYKGKVTTTSVRGCHLIADKLVDIYDAEDQKFQRKAYLENDYLGILAEEEANNNTLIAFDNSWILAGISQYIDLEAGRDVIRAQALREYIATIKPVLYADEPVARWQNKPILTDTKISKQSLRIYIFNDESFKSPDKKMYMIFAPVSADEAERIYLYLYRNIKMYSFYHYLIIQNLSLSIARDFEYLFPVEIDFVGNYVVLKSDKMLSHELQRAFELNEVSHQFSRMDSLAGCYAAYLLAEATWYSFEIRWEDRTLYIRNCGYIQGLDLREYYIRFLNDINREQVKFQKLPNFATAVDIAKKTSSKCFYFLGDYYVALPERITFEKYATSPLDPAEIEMTDPLRAVTRKDLRSSALEYLSLLGYDVTENPDPYFNDIKLGYRTYKVDLDVFTVYYYNTSTGDEIDLHEITGKSNPKIQEELEKLLQKGFFFDARTKNITSGYPGFVPNYAPLNRNLPQDPEKLLEVLANM